MNGCYGILWLLFWKENAGGTAVTAARFGLHKEVNSISVSELLFIHWLKLHINSSAASLAAPTAEPRQSAEPKNLWFGNRWAEWGFLKSKSSTAQDVQIRHGKTAKADQWAAAPQQFLKAVNKFHPKRMKRNQWDVVLCNGEIKS